MPVFRLGRLIHTSFVKQVPFNEFSNYNVLQIQQRTCGRPVFHSLIKLLFNKTRMTLFSAQSFTEYMLQKFVLVMTIGL